MLIGLDASPYGMGAWLSCGSKCLAFFSAAITQHDRLMLDTVDIEGSSLQQIVEAFIVLIALRKWRTKWCNGRVEIFVRGDNVSALHLLMKLQTSSKHLNKIARGLALDVATGTYEPDIAQHISGVTNDIADFLSRPARMKEEAPPSWLKGAVDVSEMANSCGSEWWKILNIGAMQGW